MIDGVLCCSLSLLSGWEEDETAQQSRRNILHCGFLWDIGVHMCTHIWFEIERRRLVFIGITCKCNRMQKCKSWNRHVWKDRIIVPRCCLISSSTLRHHPFLSIWIFRRLCLPFWGLSVSSNVPHILWSVFLGVVALRLSFSDFVTLIRNPHRAIPNLTLV